VHAQSNTEASLDANLNVVHSRTPAYEAVVDKLCSLASLRLSPMNSAIRHLGPIYLFDEGLNYAKQALYVVEDIQPNRGRLYEVEFKISSVFRKKKLELVDDCYFVIVLESRVGDALVHRRTPDDWKQR